MTAPRFTATREEHKIVISIARRVFADKYLALIFNSQLDVQMDIEATHCNGCPLKLQELLDADHFNFAHDICGIYRHIDRSTGKLKGHFLPRFHQPVTGSPDGTDAIAMAVAGIKKIKRKNA